MTKLGGSPDPTEIGGRLDRAGPRHHSPDDALRTRPPRAGLRTAAMVGLAGVELDPEEAALLRAWRPAGVFLFRRNIGTPDQLRALTAAIRAAGGSETIVAIDQEGGRVARLRPPDFLAHPPASGIRCERAAWLTGALIAIEAAACGIDMVGAPVLDLAVPGADRVIGDRAYVGGPETVAALGAAMAAGLGAGGVIAVGKHIPGHGRATADSHLRLPELDDIDPDDLTPFMLNRDLPAMMTAHIRYRAIDPVRAATCSETVIRQIVRHRIGFRGLLISDDLGMQALDGKPRERSAACIAAGCDVALYCSGQLAESEAVCAGAGTVSETAQARINAARDWLARHRRPDLDLATLHVERDGLLGCAL